jgi:hypothetical protein
MKKRENLTQQSDQRVLNAFKWSKWLTISLTSVLLLTMFGLGGYWLGTRQQQSSSTAPLTTPKHSQLPSTTPAQQLSDIPTITTSQTDVIARWEKYTDSKIGFEFRYPDKNYRLRNDDEINCTAPKNLDTK